MAEFVAGALSPDDAGRLERHLDTCSACAEVVARFVQLFASSGNDRSPNPSAEVSATWQGSNASELAPDEGSLAPGSKLGRYRVLEVVGSGGMGIVYAAYDPKLDRRIALKSLRGLGNDERRRRRILREAQAQARLSHPNVIAVHDCGEVGERAYIAMEYVDGQTLGRWLVERPRTWPQIREVFLAAGRGVAAAHAAGLVHRDFKPDNVLISQSGRVWVSDFGLARVFACSNRGDEPSSDGTTRRSAEMATLSRTGGLVGTPAYMAPEVFEGASVDAKADQYAFCVALYEALCGVRPHAASSLTELANKVLSEPIRELPVRVGGVPKAVRRAILIGLDRDPARRHGSMDALLDVLDARPWRMRTRTWLSLPFAALAVGLFAFWGQERPLRDCRATLPDEVWSAQRRAAVQRVLEEHGPDKEAGRRIVSAIDGYVDRHGELEREVCRAVLEDQGAPTSPLQLRCLQRGALQLDALLGIFESADREVLARGHLAVEALPPIESCADPRGLMLRAPEPPEPSVAAEVDEGGEAVGVIRALSSAGAYEEALQESTSLVRRAQALGYRPLLAEALALRGQALGRVGELEASQQVLFDAVHEATVGGARMAKVEALVHLVFVLGSHGSSFEEARRMARQAEAEILAMGGHDGVESSRLMNVGAVEHADGNFAEALEAFERAKALRDREREPLRFADTLCNIAGPLHRLGRGQEAIDHYRACLEIWEAEVGRRHPEVASTRANLGIALLGVGKLDEAAQVLHVAVEELEAASERPLPELVSALGALAATMAYRGDPQQALTLHWRALALAIEIFGARSTAVVQERITLTRALLDLDDRDAAKEQLESALDVARSVYEPGHPTMGEISELQAQLAWDEKDFERAAASMTQSLVVWRSTLGVDHPWFGDGLMRLGAIWLDGGHPERARQVLEVAVAMADQPGHEPYRMSARYVLARALVSSSGHRSSRDRARARELARSARALAVEAGHSEMAQTIEGWLDAH